MSDYESKKWEPQPGKGSLFINSYKKGDTHADYKGDILVNVKDLDVQPDGTAKMKISGWIRQVKTGGHLISLSQDRPFTPNMEAKGGFRKTSDPVGLMNSRKDKEILIDDSDVPF